MRMGNHVLRFVPVQGTMTERAAVRSPAFSLGTIVIEVALVEDAAARSTTFGLGTVVDQGALVEGAAVSPSSFGLGRVAIERALDEGARIDSAAAKVGRVARQITIRNRCVNRLAPNSTAGLFLDRVSGRARPTPLKIETGQDRPAGQVHTGWRGRRAADSRRSLSR